MSSIEVAVYRGDKFITCGPISKVADELGVKPATIQFYLSSAYQRRLSKRGGEDASLIAIRLEEDEA